MHLTTMKNTVSISALALLVIQATITPANAQSGGRYDLSWHTIDGGGGTSTGGFFTISGTIGQPDTGTLSGGSYTLAGGFWGIVSAVQSPGAPQLSIVPFGPGQARIAWTPNTPGFVLQETSSLSPTHWVNSPSGAANPVTVPATLPTKFFRLNKP
jgi:hypothetical protein